MIIVTRYGGRHTLNPDHFSCRFSVRSSDAALLKLWKTKIKIAFFVKNSRKVPFLVSSGRCPAFLEFGLKPERFELWPLVCSFLVVLEKTNSRLKLILSYLQVSLSNINNVERDCTLIYMFANKYTRLLKASCLSVCSC